METSQRVGMPLVQSMGLQGEFLMVRVLFAVDEVLDDPSLPEGSHQEVVRQLGKRAIILKMRTEDLPMLSADGEIPHFDVGRAIKEKWDG